MRLPNGYGSISKLSGKRRKPWMAKKFVCWDVDDVRKREVPKYEVVGYFEKKTQAYEALIRANTYGTQNQDPTFGEMFDEWIERKAQKTSVAMVKNYKSACKYLSPLLGKPIKSIRTYDIEACLKYTNPPRTMRALVKTIVNEVYKHAIAHDVCDRNYAELVDFQLDLKPQIQRKVFTPGEVKTLFENKDVFSDVMLIGIYTGMRPNELLSLTVEMIDGQFFRIPGSKTENGHFRDIPIHADILSVIDRNRRKSAKFNATRLFVTDRGKPFEYNWYRHQFSDHKPHDTRHSFITYAKRSGLDLLAVKRIVGHASGRDVTEDIYTHTDDDFLRHEMDKYKIE